MDYIKLLNETIRLKNEQSGFEKSDVMYLQGCPEISIYDFNNLKPYAAQANGYNGHVSVTFTKNEYHILFTNGVTERQEDRKSFEKYGGYIYLYIPITDELAKMFIDTYLV